MIYGERIKQLRELHRLTQVELAENVPPLTPSQVSRIENDSVQLDEETTALLSMTFGVTVDFLERPPHPDISFHSPHVRTRTGGLTSRERKSVLQWLRLLHEQYRRMLNSCHRIPVNLPRLHGTLPVEAAAIVRRALGFTDSEPLPYLLLTLERAGVTLLGLPFRAEVLDGVSVWFEQEPIIGVLTDAPADRMRMSIAYEVGHLVLQDPDNASPTDESQVAEFATELLMPKDAIAQEIPARASLNTLAMLKTRWGVPIKSLVRRVRELGALDSDQAACLYRQLSALGWNRAEPGYVQPEKPRAFRKLAELCYGPGPNVQLLAADAGWSIELTLEVLDRHSSAEDLPFETMTSPPVTDTNTVVLFPSMSRLGQDRG